ncbi:uncharacterized protein LOC124641345 [Helicoverpa zea]|uniref:uncharacterized protein LOC124641345 n=1 Tax=Helicoverpa zea TaxID=7113 RepID=UPI001F560149|nr:uncharacterized protein LOC124641345 [Helicoverpa zea]
MDVEVVTAAAIYLYTVYKNYRSVYRHKVIKKKCRKRRCWMLNIHRNRTRQFMDNLISDLVAEPSGEFDHFVRMSSTDFEYILQKISPIIAKKDTYWREAIPPKIRLALTLRFLATGDSYRTLHNHFKISSTLISRIIPEVCSALNQVLKDMIKIPTSPEEWLTKTEGFSFPHCLGGIDGKHITLATPHAGPEYFNYKGSFSIVLLALVDCDCCFFFADIGSQGRISNGGVLNQSNLKKKICDGTLNLPPSRPLPGSNTNMPYVFLGDGGFALSTHIMKPFPGHHLSGTPERMFNQQLTRSRAVVENTFGILSSVFRVFQKPIPLDVVKTSAITQSCLLLHNFLRKSDSSRDIYTPRGSVDSYDGNGELIHVGMRVNHKENLLPLQSVSHRAPSSATQIRSNFMNYIYQSRLCSGRA